MTKENPRKASGGTEYNVSKTDTFFWRDRWEGLARHFSSEIGSHFLQSSAFNRIEKLGRQVALGSRFLALSQLTNQPAKATSLIERDFEKLVAFGAIRSNRNLRFVRRAISNS